jgi:hypothetical protein
MYRCYYKKQRTVFECLVDWLLGYVLSATLVYLKETACFSFTPEVFTILKWSYSQNITIILRLLNDAVSTEDIL